MSEKMFRQHQRWFERHDQEGALRRRRAMMMTLSKVALVTSGLFLAAHTDIQVNKDIQETAQVQIDVRSDPETEHDTGHAIVVFAGYGSVNATIDAANIGDAFQEALGGEVWSVDYNNARIDPSQIAETISATAEARGIETISLVGRSAGGITAAETLVELNKHPRSFTTQALAFVSTPYGYQGLRQDKQRLIDLTSVLEVVPDLAYSTPLRFMGEVAIRHTDYDSGTLTERMADFLETLKSVAQAMDNGYVPGVWLRADQLLTIQQADLQSTLASIGQDWSEVPPTIMYFGTERPGFDDTVNDAASAEKIGEFAQVAQLQFLDYYVPNAVHNRPDSATDEYRLTLQSAQPQMMASFDQNQRTYELRQLRQRTYAPYLIAW